MRLFGVAAALAISLGIGMAAGPQAAVPASPGDEIKITGCVVKGEGGYVLLPLAEEGGTGSTLPPAGTSGVERDESVEMIRVLYWLEDDGDVEDHAGQRVEITGEVEDDLDRGEISIEREDGLVEVEFKHDGETITVKLPNLPSSIGTSGAVTDEEKDYEYAIRPIDVKSVKMLASTCR
jgi:hypothetical protein